MKDVEIVEASGIQHRLTIRKDGATIKIAPGMNARQKEEVTSYFMGIVKKHLGTPVTLRGSTNKIQLGISLFNDARTQCFHHEGSFA